MPREESRQRFNETLDILQLALSGERFSYEGEIFTVPEMSLRPEPRSRDLFSRVYSSSSTAESLEILARRGMVPLFVGNKPIEDAGREVQRVNTFRKEEGLPPCQPKNVMFMYCTAGDPAKSEEWIWTANRDVTVHYGFADASNFKGRQGLRGLCGPGGQRDRRPGLVGHRRCEGSVQDPGLPRLQPADRDARGNLRADRRRPEGLLVLRADDRPAIRHHALRRGGGEHGAVRQGGAARRARDGRALHPAALPENALA